MAAMPTIEVAPKSSKGKHHPKSGKKTVDLRRWPQSRLPYDAGQLSSSDEEPGNVAAEERLEEELRKVKPIVIDLTLPYTPQSIGRPSSRGFAAKRIGDPNYLWRRLDEVPSADPVVREDALVSPLAIDALSSTSDPDQTERLGNGDTDNSTTSADFEVNNTLPAKTSKLGPKRVERDDCRKRRIRCEHKDQAIEKSQAGTSSIDISGSYSISVNRRLDDDSVAEQETSSPRGSVTAEPHAEHLGQKPRARVNRCARCRRYERRYIHDENGVLDPIKQRQFTGYLTQ